MEKQKILFSEQELHYVMHALKLLERDVNAAYNTMLKMDEKSRFVISQIAWELEQINDLYDKVYVGLGYE